MTQNFQQQYHVTRIETYNPALPLLDFSSTEPARGPMGALGDRPMGTFSCQMFVYSLHAARLIVSRPDALLSGVYAINRIWPMRTPLKVKRINYVIVAWPGLNGETAECYHQEFTHKCYGSVMLLQSGELRSSDGPLFKRQALNQLLDSDRFPLISGIQFVA